MANNNERRGRWQGFDLGGGSSGEPRRMRTSPFVWILGFLVILVLFNYLASPRPETVDYSVFLQHVRGDRIEGTLEISQTSVAGEFGGPDGDPVDFTTTIPPILQGTSTLTELLDENGVEYTGVTPSPL